MGPCSRDRKRPSLSSRLGRRLGSMVQLQVPKFGSWKHCWPVCTREVGRKAKVRGVLMPSLTHSPIPSPATPCFLLLRFLRGGAGLYVDVYRLQIRGLVGT